jgi:hypothetical protein
MRCSVTKNGFWIEWLDLLALLLQLQSIIIVSSHNQWLPNTHSIPYSTTSVFSSAVTDLDPIYESVTSSASIVRRLTLHSWTLNSLTSDECRTTAHSSLTGMNWTNSFITSGRTEYKSPCLTVPLLLCFSVFILCHGNVLTEPLPSNGLSRVCSLQRKRAFGEPLASNGLPLWLHYSGFQASCHSILILICLLRICCVDDYVIILYHLHVVPSCVLRMRIPIVIIPDMQPKFRMHFSYVLQL